MPNRRLMQFIFDELSTPGGYADTSNDVGGIRGVARAPCPSACQ